MTDSSEIEKMWNEEKPLYHLLGERTVAFLKSEIPKHELLPEISFRTKELLSIVKKLKRKQKEKDYAYHDLKDKLGIRIICSFSSDLEIIDNILKKNFEIIKAEYKKEELEYDKLDYTSNHYDVKVKTDKIYFESPDLYKDYVYEIQVRSINQHAWSSSSHILTYKRDAEIPKKLQRKVYRLLSLYEIADDEFSAVNRELIEQESNLAYQFIRKFEGKIYKYAGVDFDRQTSLYTLKILLTNFPSENQEGFMQKIESFIESNTSKLEHIFETNKIRYHQIPYLTQPEVFLIFYLLEKFPAQLEEVYANELDEDELEQLKAIWG